MYDISEAQPLCAVQYYERSISFFYVISNPIVAWFIGLNVIFVKIQSDHKEVYRVSCCGEL